MRLVGPCDTVMCVCLLGEMDGWMDVIVVLYGGSLDASFEPLGFGSHHKQMSVLLALSFGSLRNEDIFTLYIYNIYTQARYYSMYIFILFFVVFFVVLAHPKNDAEGYNFFEEHQDVK